MFASLNGFSLKLSLCFQLDKLEFYESESKDRLGKFLCYSPFSFFYGITSCSLGLSDRSLRARELFILLNLN